MHSTARTHPFRIVGIGEVLWDLLPTGRQLGGAPGNFVYHARALGADGCMISRVGDDENGRQILERLRTLGMPVHTIEVDSTAPTGTVSVDVSDRGQPRFTIHEDVAWDRLSGSPAAEAAVAQADAVCFGSLAQRQEPARSTILDLLRHTRAGALRLFDINLRQHYHTPERIADSLRLADILKVNDEELPQLAGWLGLPGDVRSQLARLCERFHLRGVACTRGAHGSLLLRDGEWSEHPGVPTTVADTVGAGDSFTAAMTMGLLAGWDLDTINHRANEVAAHVASQPGGTPPLPEHLTAPFHGILSAGTISKP